MIEYYRPSTSQSTEPKRISPVYARKSLPPNWTYNLRINNHATIGPLTRNEIYGELARRDLLDREVVVLPHQRILNHDIPKRKRLTSTPRNEREAILGESA